ncbi:MAG: hypothetical protein Q4G71_17510 [Pseudomonadota bacterium]|nr:hypothetical protein [Pseudomonadota bacterium]
MTDPARQLHDARQMKRLRELRERSALQALHAAEAAVRDAEAAMREREAVMRRLQAEREQLSQRIVGDCAPRMGRLAVYASAAQEVLDDQLERTEYALLDDEEALHDARQKAAQTRAVWLRAVGQHSAAGTLVGDARKALRRDREARLDREDAPAWRPSH